MDTGKEKLERKLFEGERSLFQGRNLMITDCIFGEGESPLKHSENIELEGTVFQWKYPLWYSKHIRVRNCTLFEMARAGIWYTDDIEITDTLIEAPKEFRRCKDIRIRNVSIPRAEETLWNCQNVEISQVMARGEYFGMNCENVKIDGLTLYGDYCFDGARNVEVHNSKLLSKDCFWNAENITIYDSYISGEYLAWNSKNVTLINCTVESLQGMCYIENLVMKNCKLVNTTLAFEYSTVDAEIDGRIQSVLNPGGGTITCEGIGELILQKDRIDVNKTIIICRGEEGCPEPVSQASGMECSVRDC